ncbi:hypothetical protein B0H14DRAFT_2585503 [Mycena olivaceomarginata]|nr:hypothetical protein B0H14DRAFT_2585503 [Mycena olivaceomarginata]
MLISPHTIRNSHFLEAKLSSWPRIIAFCWARNVHRAAALADGARLPYIGDVTERRSCGEVCASSPSSLFFFIQLMARSTSPADSASPRSAPRVSPEKGAEPTASHRQTRAVERSISVTRNIPVPDTPPQFAPIRRCDCPRRNEEKLGADYLMLRRVRAQHTSRHWDDLYHYYTQAGSSTDSLREGQDCNFPTRPAD